MYIKQFYSVGKRMPNGETTPVLLLSPPPPPPTHTHTCILLLHHVRTNIHMICLAKCIHCKREKQSFSATLTSLVLATAWYGFNLMHSYVTRHSCPLQKW